MGAAYTFYKFKALIILVGAILLVLAIGSQLNPAIKETENSIINSIDPSGTASSVLELEEKVSDPKGEIKQVTGNYLFNLLDKNPNGFLILVVLITIFLFSRGVYLRTVRGFLRSL